ncbi:MAG TPA: hypothetical protein PLW65_11020, partial [Pseudomonadota bacterium]|nr:hypothetical protein [Pseudomonadota bacterium]
MTARRARWFGLPGTRTARTLQRNKDPRWTTVSRLPAAFPAESAVARFNVEQWFRYSPQFRRNLAGLPRDDKTVVVRTLARGELPAPDQDRWHFSVQTLDDFLFRMESAQPPAQGVLDLMPAMARSHQPGLRGLSWLGAVRAQPRPRLEWALLPPLRDDQAP